MVEGEAGCVGGFGCGGSGVQVTGGNAGFEDALFEARRNTGAVVDDGKGAVAMGPQGRGDEDVGGSGIAGVADQFREGILNGAYSGGGTPGSLPSRQAGEPRAQVPVRSFIEPDTGALVNVRPRSRGSRG